jgi:hypothetical protein
MAEHDVTSSTGGSWDEEPEYLAEHVGIGRGMRYVTKEGLLVISGGEVLLLLTPDEIIDSAPVSEVEILSKPKASFGTALSLKLRDETYKVEPEGMSQGLGLFSRKRLRRSKAAVEDFESALEAARGRAT